MESLSISECHFSSHYVELFRTEICCYCGHPSSTALPFINFLHDSDIRLFCLPTIREPNFVLQQFFGFLLLFSAA